MDILRRLLEDYFGYEVFMQVNVTDIDDKIIARACPMWQASYTVGPHE